MKYTFLDSKGSFRLENAENDYGLYFPIAGEQGLKSAVSPNLSGDAKVDQNHFVLEPESIENLNNNKSTRNFWLNIRSANGKNAIWSATGMSAMQEAMRYTQEQDASYVEVGYMWHKSVRESKSYGVRSEILSFVPVNENMEIMQVSITNTGSESVEFTPTAAIPIYGRSADNIRDHRHVTSLLHRAIVTEYGVEVHPTLSFDERGHQICDSAYFVYGMEGEKKAPIGVIPEVARFIGKSGSFMHPEAVVTDQVPCMTKGDTMDGQEVVGALRFENKVLCAGETVVYTIYFGITPADANIAKQMDQYLSSETVAKELQTVKDYWNNKVNVAYHTGDEAFDHFMEWVSFQPELRRVYGCSFLPHHDYGKGGRGWRDLWQDCLALLMMNPGGVREMLISNFGGVRMDGSNATIIGSKPGEFKADRNSITRVWMDHGVWPAVTMKFYIDQTGDDGILYEKAPYFKDRQVLRGKGTDEAWTVDMKWQQDEKGKEYTGTVLEHLILQNVASFMEVGAHNHILLRDADWNDAIDMAHHKGESVAFTNAYAMNLENIAELLKYENAKGVEKITLLKEIYELLLLDAASYDSIEAKTAHLLKFMEAGSHVISGETVEASVLEVAGILSQMSEWIKEHIRKTEWVTDGKGNGWYNGYYDDHGNRVEGVDADGNVRMMLTGQVFSIMSKTATKEQVAAIAQSADCYLYDEACGGYRLNTDFHELKTDMGRMFGFAYGEKENGAVFSHMAVMYANALYGRGFAKEGYRSLKALYAQSMNADTSRIYPGVPEYFGKDGRGLYHYLTGAASWYMMTVITRMFGARGDYGNLLVEPALMAEQFDQGKASLSLTYAGVEVTLNYSNPKGLEVGDYRITEAMVNGQSAGKISEDGKSFVLSREELSAMKDGCTIGITLG